MTVASMMAALLSCLTLAIWAVLRYGRGGFWQVALPRTGGAMPEGRVWPDVVAIVPARNEADVIAQAVHSLLTQDYPGALRVVVIDDHSEDGTAEAARAAAAALGEQATARLRIVGARTLPKGWSGKVWAQSEGIAASGTFAPGAEWFWLTDADIVHPPHGLRDLVLRGEQGKRDMVSLMVRLRCSALPERMLIPAFVFFFAKLYPFRWIADDAKATAGAAGGCILLRHGALTRIGGLAAIKGALIDDCALAAAVKRGGSVRLDLADAAVSLRPYDGWKDIWNMIARTAYTQLHYSPWLLIGATLGMVLTYLAPPLLTIVGLLSGAPWGFAGLAAWVLMTRCYMPMLRYYKQSPLWAVALPVVACFYMAATLDSGWRHSVGRGGHWKGRAQSSNVTE